ncbi:PPC domain-containing protein [Aporhodopirellula aestuarii]|uniref:PPC domain-containing protein n=1 Tax=Aporhodopirellula aestuarii TaxID=2950107 RepID=A0ABT0U1W8_9BACT|nr:PPC domain-containing protein [Aporhodopirellula aestuarii]MCM2370897.1 PPC domain-containing protein [Aporhodopirellula aestuarii]
MRSISHSLMFRRYIATAVLSICFGQAAMAAFPVVTHHQPLGVTRGGEATVVLHGNQLSDAREVLFDQPGVEVIECKPIDNKSIELKVKTEATLQPGMYSFRVVTASGITNLRFLSVGTMPIVEEVEPNNDFATPQEIPMDCTVEGNVDREDVDHFRVSLKAGQKLTVEIEGMRHRWSLSNRDILDPYIAILDDKRFEVAVSDDSLLFQQDGICSFTPEEDGQYTVLVRDSSFLGQRNICRYRLHVGSFPRPTTIIPSGGVQGELLKAKLIDIDGTITDASVQLPTDFINPENSRGTPTQPYPVITEDKSGISPSPNWIRVGNLPIVNEVEPNNDHRKAPECSVPALLSGVIGEPGDFDCFTFECKKNEKFRVQLYARETLRSPLDGVMNVFDASGKTLKSSDDIGGKLDGSFDFTAASDSKHTIRIYDHLRGGSPLHNYLIEVSRLEPSFSLDLKELRRDEAMVVPVPIGGHGAMMVQAKRDQYNGEIALELDGVPEGVTVQTFPIPPGRIEIPVVLTASADASLAGTFFDVIGRGQQGDQVLTADLQQHHKIVLGQNRRAMLEHSTPKAVMAVCEAMPFSIELVQPKTPVLRRGSKELLVRIKRNEGFENAVYLKTLYNPPGVGVNNSRKIDKGQNEVTIPITANANAAMGTWPLVMQVSYGTKLGTQTVASAPIMLDVENAVFNYKFPRAAAETGGETQLMVTMEKIRDIEGEMEVQLVGLPNGVTCEAPVQKVTLESTSVTFPLKIAADAKTGVHKTLNVQTRISRDGETMVQTDGTGEIRVDKPVVKKDPAAAPEKKPKPKPKTDAPPKPLSRLEQLRQEKESS